MTQQDRGLYDLELHEEMRVSADIFVLRVPGGWLYQSYDVNRDCAVALQFVPFHNEFQEPSSA